MSSGFISEAELSEKRRARQEEWEKVRKPGQPDEAPEEEFDSRSLFDRLEEQKQKRDIEYEEAHKLKNMIKGLDDDEVEFLDLVDRSKLEEEKRKTQEEEREIKDFRNAVASLQEKSLQSRITAEIRPKLPNNTSNPNPRGSSQVKLLAGAVVRKRSAANDNTSTPKEKKICLEQNENSIPNGDNSSSPNENSLNTNTNSNHDENQVNTNLKLAPALQCIGILPGLGSYPDSSDSEASSDTDQELNSSGTNYDLVGRKVTKIKKTSVKKVKNKDDNDDDHHHNRTDDDDDDCDSSNEK